MKLTGVLGGSVFAFLFGYAVVGTVDLAQAQSICSCPAGSTNLGGGHCQTLSCPATATLGMDPAHPGSCRQPADTNTGFIDVPAISTISNATCHSATPNIGQIAASEQQLSFSTVPGVLGTRRDQLQGPLGSQPSAASPLAYSAFGDASLPG